ncbi:MAG: DUF1588 domain-containing protein [Archangium sp.]
MRRESLVLLAFTAACPGSLTPTDPKPNAPQLAACFDGTQRTPVTPAPRIRRLSRYELVNTFESLKSGSGARVTALLPADAVRDGYDSDADLLRASELYVDAVRRLSEEVSAQLDAAVLLPCGGAACADAFVRDFGARIFRRPLRPAELPRFRAVFDTVAADDGAVAGARATIEAFLQSPSFLYRTELGDTSSTLTNDELANALSYGLWAGPPDQTLLSASLRDDAVRAEQVRRLLADTRARQALDHFAEQWLELERLDSAVRSPALFPIDSPALRAALRREALDSFANAGTLSDFLTARPASVSAELTPIYGSSWGAERAGVFGLGALLMAHSTSETSSPVHRGKLVRARFFCQSLPPPPPGINAALPDFVPGQSNRERFAAHSTNAACSGCHHLMDPIGLGFERFDAMGRTIDADARGEVLDSTTSVDGPFDGVPELAGKMAADQAVAACVLSQWSRHALGVSASAASCGENGLLPSSAAPPATMRALLEVPFTAPNFARRSMPSPDADEPPVPDAGMPMMSTGVTTSVRVDSDWGAGSCRTVFVDNHTAAAQTWNIELAKVGTITSLWNAMVDESGAQWRFSGAAHNATVQPMEGTSFGFCVTTP